MSRFPCERIPGRRWIRRRIENTVILVLGVALAFLVGWIMGSGGGR